MSATKIPQRVRPVLRAAVRDDGGFAFATVLGAMFALSIVVVASLTYATGQLTQGRRSQDFQAAVAAAQAGVDDFLSRLNTCDSYWTWTSAAQTPCTGSAVNEALRGNWVSIPGSSSVTPAQFKYSILTRPDNPATPGIIRLQADGKVGAQERQLVVDLRKAGFLEYIYYTDKESSDPLGVQLRYRQRKVKVEFSVGGQTYSELIFAGVQTWQANKCGRHYYATTGQPGTRASGGQELVRGLRKNSSAVKDLTTIGFGCDIQFASIDEISGRLHTNDAILLDQPLFSGRTTTSWAAGASPAPTAGAWYRKVNASSAPKAAGQQPVYGPPIELPPNNQAIRAMTVAASGGTGCLYTGATEIILKDDRMDVISPGTTSWNPGCQPGTNRPLPPNGVVYVDQLPAGRNCTGKAAGKYPVTGDITPYSCRKGDVFVSGRLSGKMTIAAKNDIVVTGDLTYKDGLNGTDIMGLVADDFISVYHPVGCATAPPAGYWCSTYPFFGGSLTNDFVNLPVKDGQPLTNVQIDAAMLSVQHSFTVQNFDKGPKLGALTVRGGIYQNYRGPVGTGGGGGGTGYAKDYRYDPRLMALPPPHFINPLSAPWQTVTLSEQ